MVFTIFLAIMAGSVFSLIGAFILSRKESWEQSLTLQLTAFASGVLLTTALLHLAPESILELGRVQPVFVSMFIAILIFFLLERMAFWFHHHHDFHDVKPVAWLITIGDSLHNFIDGFAIASSFLVDPKLGIITTFAVALHEIPQEIADFIILIKSGMSRSKALLINVLSSLTAVVGGAVALAFSEALESFLPLVIAFSAGMFLYIALSDLIPELHMHDDEKGSKWLQVFFLILGVVLTYGVTQAVESYFPVHAHDEDGIHFDKDEGHDEEYEVMHDDSEVDFEGEQHDDEDDELEAR